jgi:hypothetical protein
VQESVVDEHAAQFDETIGDRPAGSQREFAASTYILGHLQQAGYVPLLDPVPVEDTVRSTNVVAPPPRGAEPRVVVTAAYDTAPGIDETGVTLGVWLELARALYARAPDHAVEFVALGAEHSQLYGGNLGSRRLIEFLRDDDLEPLVISIEALSEDGDAALVFGLDAERVLSFGQDLDVPVRRAERADDADELFVQAGVSHVAVSGGAHPVADLLLELLAAQDVRMTRARR